MNRLDLLRTMKWSPVRNYGGIPGLTSWLIGAPNRHGLVRLMECSRSHQEPIVPHSHRFDFACEVLSGQVRNVLWHESAGGDEFIETPLLYEGMGNYIKGDGKRRFMLPAAKTYCAGQFYGMKSHEIHSIYFERGTSVLFFEGPQLGDTSVILEPFVNGEVVPTFEVRDWMFKVGAPA